MKKYFAEMAHVKNLGERQQDFMSHLISKQEKSEAHNKYFLLSCKVPVAQQKSSKIIICGNDTYQDFWWKILNFCVSYHKQTWTIQR